MAFTKVKALFFRINHGVETSLEKSQFQKSCKSHLNCPNSDFATKTTVFKVALLAILSNETVF